MAALDVPALAALGVVVPALGSLVLGLAMAEGRLDAVTAHALGALDELFQAEAWGEDAEAAARRAAIADDIAARGALSATDATGGTGMNCKRLIISGRVQGVGFRVWMVEKARELGVSGWVRNRIDGSVEALVAGDTAAVEELLRLCRRGPRMAEVVSIEEDLADPPEDFGFRQLATK